MTINDITQVLLLLPEIPLPTGILLLAFIALGLVFYSLIVIKQIAGKKHVSKTSDEKE